MIEISNIIKTFKSKSGLNLFELYIDHLVFPNKGLFLISGKSGCGKSTLLNILRLNLTSDKGKIKYDDIDYLNENLKDKESFLINNISYVSQENNLFNELNIMDNIKFNLSSKNKFLDESKLKEYLNNFRLDEDFLTKFPSELSNGERQRISIVSALLEESNILLLDEPTNRVNDEDTENIFKILKKEASNKLIICVSHDVVLLEKYIDGSILLENGRLIKNDILINEENFNNAKSTRLKPNFYELFKLSFKNLKYKMKKTTALFIGMLVSLSLIIVSINLLTNSWESKTDSLIVSNHKQLGLVSKNQVFNDQEKETINETFKNNAVYTFKSNDILKRFDYLFKDSRIINSNANLDNFDFKMIEGNIPYQKDEVAISDIAILNTFKEDNNFKDISINEVKNKYNELKSIFNLRSGLKIVGLYNINNEFNIYKDRSNFALDFIREYNNYSLYDSLMIEDSLINEIKDIENSSYCINIENYDILETLYSFNEEDVLKVNPFEIYKDYEVLNRRYFNIGALITFSVFLLTFLVLSIIYLRTFFDNHKYEYSNIINLGFDCNKIMFTNFISMLVQSIVLVVLSYIFSTIIVYSLASLNTLFFNYNLMIFDFNYYSLLVILGVIILTYIFNLLINIKEIKSLK